MKYVKNMLIILTVIGFSCSNAFAMETLLGRATKHVCRKGPTHKTAKRLVTSKASKKNLTPDKISKPRSFNEILETPIIAKRKPPSYTLPKDFFIENREGVTVERINERLLYVHLNKKMEKEVFVNNEARKQYHYYTEHDKTLELVEPGKSLTNKELKKIFAPQEYKETKEDNTCSSSYKMPVYRKVRKVDDE